MNPITMTDIMQWVRPNIRSLTPYSSAKSEFDGEGYVYLDANENPFPTEFNRYPDLTHKALRQKIGTYFQKSPDQISLGVGSDELIDLIYKVFAIPEKDTVIIHPPTFDMYRIAAIIADVKIKEVPLVDGVTLNVEEILNHDAKIVFICSPNNPTGVQFPQEDVISILDNFQGIVVLDEAYGEFANYSMLAVLEKYPNLIILKTFSKAFGAAGLRLGMLFANPNIVELINRVKLPYNINSLTLKIATNLMDDMPRIQEEIETILSEKEKLSNALENLAFVEKIYPSHTNFILVQVEKPQEIYDYLKEQGVLVRSQINKKGCENSLRITVGTPEENERLMEYLNQWQV